MSLNHWRYIGWFVFIKLVPDWGQLHAWCKYIALKLTDTVHRWWSQKKFLLICVLNLHWSYSQVDNDMCYCWGRRWHTFGHVCCCMGFGVLISKSRFIHCIINLRKVNEGNMSSGCIKIKMAPLVFWISAAPDIESANLWCCS